MKKRINIVLLFVLTLLLTGCSNKYQGYWCQYTETATIDVQLEYDVTEEQKAAIEAKISSFDNIASMNHYSREDYAEELNTSIENIDVHENYVLLFNSIDSIGTYVDELAELDGVFVALQSNAKTNISLYNIKKNGQYTFTDSDEALESDLVKGKYKIKNFRFLRDLIEFLKKENSCHEKSKFLK